MASKRRYDGSAPGRGRVQLRRAAGVERLPMMLTRAPTAQSAMAAGGPAGGHTAGGCEASDGGALEWTAVAAAAAAGGGPQPGRCARFWRAARLFVAYPPVFLEPPSLWGRAASTLRVCLAAPGSACEPPIMCNLLHTLLGYDGRTMASLATMLCTPLCTLCRLWATCCLGWRSNAQYVQQSRGLLASGAVHPRARHGSAGECSRLLPYRSNASRHIQRVGRAPTTRARPA